MRTIRCSDLVGLTISLAALCGTARAAAGFAGFPACPVDAPKEVALVASARDTSLPSVECATVVVCTNLDKVDRNVKVQFFPGSSITQVGVDATILLGPGITREFGTRAGEPLGTFGVNAPANTGGFEGKGRICADTKKLACDAFVSCATSNGATLANVKVFLKKQVGD